MLESDDACLAVHDVKGRSVALVKQRRKRQPGDTFARRIGQDQRRRHSELHLAAGTGHGKFGEVSSCCRIRRGREFTKLGDMALVRLGPDRDLRFTRSRACQKCFGDRNHDLLFSEPCDTNGGLARSNDLARLDQGCRDNPRRVRGERRVGQTVFRKFDRSLCTIEPCARFIGGRLGLVQLRVGRPAFLPQVFGAGFSGTRLGKNAGRGAEFGRGLLRLQIEIDLVERRERLSGSDDGADLDQTL